MDPDVAALYLDITNDGGADVLTGVETSTGTASLHQAVVNDDGTAGMEALDTIDIAKDSTVTFSSNGYHVMIDAPETLETGDTVTVTLSFETSAPVTVEADVVEFLQEDAHAH